jgi:polyisoprenoid-binding protein YceI
MRHTAPLLLLVLAGSACAVPVDNAAPRDATGAASADAQAPIEVRPLALRPGAKRYIVLGRRSRLEIKGHDSVLGDHVLGFERWWARIEAEPPSIVVDIDLRSLHSDEDLVTSITKDHLLEVERYPHATLVGSLAETNHRGEIVIDGLADVHGKKIPLRFVGAISEEGDGYRFRASFDMSRRAFDISYTPAEPFLDDSFRVSVNAVATPERVHAEEL